MRKHKQPHGNIFYRRMQTNHPLIVSGEGVYLYDGEGKRYLDGSGGAIVVNIGHGVKKIAEAIAAQASQAAYLHASIFTSSVLEEYARALGKITPLPDPKFYFLTSGTEAIEAAIKLGRQFSLNAAKLADQSQFRAGCLIMGYPWVPWLFPGKKTCEPPMSPCLKKCLISRRLIATVVHLD